MVHRWKETGEVPDGREGLVLRRKLERSGVTRETYWTEGLHEVPVAYNVLTNETRALILPVSPEKKVRWKDGFGDDWITGTADYVGALLDTPWVDDLKTGRKVEYLSYRYQQAFYALVWSNFGEFNNTTCRSTITHWPKYPLDGKPIRFGTVLEPDFFDEFKGRLRRLRDEVLKLKEVNDMENVVSYLTEGEHCVYCPSRSICNKGKRYGRD
jgi:hypothetical protein